MDQLNRSTGTADDNLRRIAVIAVHGVGTHPPFASARAIGDMLSDLTYDPPDTPRYGPFKEVVGRINVRRLQPTEKGAATWWGRIEDAAKGSMAAIAKAVYNRSRTVSDKDGEPNSLDHLFMQAQISAYKGEEPEDTFQTLCLKGKRISPPESRNASREMPAADTAGAMLETVQEGTSDRAQGTPLEEHAQPKTTERAVDVYEMYWADLSNVGNAFTSIFREFYQVILHLGSVGENNVKAAAIHLSQLPEERIAARRWRVFDRVETFAAKTLAKPIAILNLLLAALVVPLAAVSLMRTHLSSTIELIVAGVLTILAGLVVAGLGLFRKRQLSYAAFVTPTIGALAAISAFAIAELGKPMALNRSLSEGVVALIALIAAAFGIAEVVKAYERRRPGAIRVAKILVVGLSVAIAAAMWWTNPFGELYPVISACFLAIEITLLALGFAWFVFWFAYVAGFFVGRWAAFGPRCPVERDKAKRTWWTARLCLAIPACAFFLVSFIVWSGVAKAVVASLPGEENASSGLCSSKAECPPKIVCAQYKQQPDEPCKGVYCASVTYVPVTSRLIFGRGGVFSDASYWVRIAVCGVAACAALPLLLVVLCSLLIAGWGLAPSIAAEVKPFRAKPSNDSGWLCELNERSGALGRWLTDGYRSLRIAGEMLYLGFVAIPFLFLICFGVKFFHSAAFCTLCDGFALGGALSFTALIAAVARISKSARTVVQVLLDIDNWLREHPKESTPTARICGRYVSLLKDILAAKPKYSAIVIIAHSQGTVITSDFLRYLTAERNKSGSFEKYDAELKRLDEEVPIYLFTMGSPLGQLYNLRFPYLYSYGSEPVVARSACATSDIFPDIAKYASPDPDKLRVKAWWNAFRSGDYIGRYLWRESSAEYLFSAMNTTEHDDWNPPATLPQNISFDSQRSRIEFCIGPGAHMHYWDGTAKLVSEVLDKLITLA